METKKSPKANLENYSKLFIQLGLVLALLIVYLGIEFKTFDRDIGDLGMLNLSEELEEDIPITERIEQIKPPPPPPPAPEVIEVVEDEEEVEETMLESTETDEDEVVEVEEIVEVVEEEEVAEDVPFAIIEDAPIFPGCKGNKKQLRDCLQESIKKHVNRKFDVNLAGELGLDPGKKKVYVQFKIDRNGKIVDVRARGPHARLEKEGVKVVNTLPKMIPGKQRGRPVGVKYTLPITLLVE
ncbi:energy transducer TonB [Aureibaculum conchae]|uniref:energy transducer TonB n=1 Tax=Aureibaculum sp. 2308TA14-22 TaxID=3108392 RepID=UPI003398D8CB